MRPLCLRARGIAWGMKPQGYRAPHDSHELEPEAAALASGPEVVSNHSPNCWSLSAHPRITEFITRNTCLILYTLYEPSRAHFHVLDALPLAALQGSHVGEFVRLRLFVLPC